VEVVIEWSALFWPEPIPKLVFRIEQVHAKQSLQVNIFSPWEFHETQILGQIRHPHPQMGNYYAARKNAVAEIEGPNKKRGNMRIPYFP
jgi:hypothetical protein